MFKYICKRLAYSLLILLGVSIIIYFLIRLMPVDYIQTKVDALSSNGGTIDPDMYQVYHKNSTATSVLTWGYDAILANPSMYPIENGIINKLSDVIDAARATDNQAERAELYKEAMGYVLDLAVELPVYQRSVLYAYNSKVISSDSLPKELNPYTEPLSRIWEIEFAN